MKRGQSQGSTGTLMSTSKQNICNNPSPFDGVGIGQCWTEADSKFTDTMVSTIQVTRDVICCKERVRKSLFLFETKEISEDAFS